VNQRPVKNPTASIDLSERTPNSLDLVEARDLERAESKIAANLAAFFQVGFALLEIKSRRLYRADYPTFDEYCRKRWEMHKAYAYRLIGAAEVCRTLSPIGDIPLPENECQIRPLIGLTRAVALKAWRRAFEEAGPSGKVTGLLVQKAVGEVTGRRLHQKNIFKCHWQISLESLLNEALAETRYGNQDRVSELIDKASLLLLVGKNHRHDAVS
jgi:hypothetical protein